MNEFQYFKGVKIKPISAIHDLRAMYEMTLEYAAEVFRNDIDDNVEFQF
jgi:hypothetical protein